MQAVRDDLAHLQRVKCLAGPGMVDGYATLNAIGLGPNGERGLLYHRLYSSTALNFASEPAEITTAVRSTGTALTPLATDVALILDAGFDNIAVWREIWRQQQHMLCRVRTRTRLVRPDQAPLCSGRPCRACGRWPAW